LSSRESRAKSRDVVAQEPWADNQEGPSARGQASSLLKNPLSPRLLKKVQMQGGMRKAE